MGREGGGGSGRLSGTRMLSSRCDSVRASGHVRAWLSACPRSSADSISGGRAFSAQPSSQPAAFTALCLRRACSTSLGGWQGRRGRSIEASNQAWRSTATALCVHVYAWRGATGMAAAADGGGRAPKRGILQYDYLSCSQAGNIQLPANDKRSVHLYGLVLMCTSPRPTAGKGAPRARRSSRCARVSPRPAAPPACAQR